MNACDLVAGGVRLENKLSPSGALLLDFDLREGIVRKVILLLPRVL